MIPEQAVTVRSGPGPALEAALAVPPGARVGVVVCHPHPRYGGDMDSPIVATAAAACVRQGVATLRFNFRGVGASEGAWDEGRGERDDVRAALACLRSRLAEPAPVGLAGYSFGAAMAASVAATGEPLAGLALIAPPLATPGWPSPGPPDGAAPLLIVAGSEDSYCPPGALASLATAWPTATVTVIDGADHFFFTGLPELEAALEDWAVRLSRTGS
jgi:uncharacterized protein